MVMKYNITIIEMGTDVKFIGHNHVSRNMFRNESKESNTLLSLS